MKYSSVVREQLALASGFMAATGGDRFWDGEMPAYPDENFDPDDWQQRNKPIYVIWKHFLSELWYEGLYARHVLASQLPIADLLAASRVCADKYREG